MTIPTPERVLLKDRAYDHLRGLIVEGTYPPGRFISERELTAELGMSKTPIKAALERLAEQGFVTISPQRGVIVRALTPHEIADHYDFRMAVESWIMRHLAGRLTHAQAERIRVNLMRQKELARRPVDIVGYTAADAEFHQMLAEFTGNDEFVRAMAHQRDKLRRVVEQIALRETGAPTRSCGEHRAIADALLAADGDRAARLVVEHLEHGKQFLLAGGTYGE